MKNALLWILTLALGIYVQEAVAQQEDPKPKPKLKIIIKEKDGEEKVYEYDSAEALRNDPRLKGQALPGFEELGTHDAAFQLRVKKLHMAGDSLREQSFRLYLRDGEAIKGEHHLLQHRQQEGDSSLQHRLKEMGVAFSQIKELNVFKLSGDSMMADGMPEEVRKLMREQGAAFGEGEQFIILRRQNGVPVPPMPPLPPLPPAPDIEPPMTPAVAAPEWLNELSIYPNPVADQLQVRFRAQSSGPAILRLIDMRGKAVYEEKLPDANLLQEKTIRIPAGQKGVMLLQIEQGQQKYTHRILVQ